MSTTGSATSFRTGASAHGPTAFRVDGRIPPEVYENWWQVATTILGNHTDQALSEGVDGACGLPSFVSIRQAYEQGVTNVLVVYVGPDTASIGHYAPACYAPGLERVDPAHAALLFTSFTIGGVEYGTVLVFCGNTDQFQAVHNHMRVGANHFLVMPPETAGDVTRAALLAAAPVVLREATSFLFLGSKEYLYQVCLNRNVDFVSKVASCVRHYYPWTDRYLDAKYSYAPPAVARKLFGQDPPEEAPPMESEDDQKWMAQVAVLLLGPAYTRADQLSAQIHRRLTAARATYTTGIIHEEIVTTAIGEVGLDVKDIPSVLFELMGYWLAITHEMEYNLEVTSATMANPFILKEQGVFTHHFPAAMMAQAQLVYDKKHLSTAIMAVTFRDEIRQYTEGLREVWGQELKTLDRIAPVVTECPFFGLRITQLVDFQHKNYPRMATVGVRLFKEMATEDQKRTLGHYITSDFSTNFDGIDHAEMDIIQRVASSMKDKAIIRFLQCCAYSDAELFADTMKPEDRKKVLAKLYELDNPGVYASHQREQDRLVFWSDYLAHLRTALLTRLDREVNAWNAEIVNIEDTDERKDVVGQMLQWKAHCQQQIDALTDREDPVPIRVPHVYQAEHQQYLATFRGILGLISNRGMDGPGEPPGQL